MTNATLVRGCCCDSQSQPCERRRDVVASAEPEDKREAKSAKRDQGIGCRAHTGSAANIRVGQKAAAGKYESHAKGPQVVRTGKHHQCGSSGNDYQVDHEHPDNPGLGDGAEQVLVRRQGGDGRMCRGGSIELVRAHWWRHQHGGWHVALSFGEPGSRDCSASPTALPQSH